MHFSHSTVLLATVCAGIATANQAPSNSIVPWTPPKTTIAAPFVKQVAFLHAHGFGDPRGGVYRHAEILVENLNNGGKPASQCGWVLPNGKFVAWNGLVYQPIRVGQLADLAQDVKTTVSNLRLHADSQGAENQLEPMVEEKCALLLLLNRSHDAESIFKELHFNPNLLGYFLSSDYLISRHNRAIAAHMRGDDTLSFSDATYLLKERPAFEQLYSNLTVRNRNRRDPNYTPQSPFFSFLDDTEVLAKDEARRLAQKPKPTFDLNAVLKLSPDQKAPVQVDYMDEIAAPEYLESGQAVMGYDPIVFNMQLSEQPLISALLDCMDHDDRLTRSVIASPATPERPKLLTVASVARDLLISKFSIFTINPRGEEFTTATDLRSFFAKYKGLSEVDILYSRLCDDSLSEDAWAEAAEHIVSLSNTQFIHGKPYGCGSATKPPYMRGAELRAKNNPSVSEELAKRVRSMLIQAGQKDLTGLTRATNTAIAFYRWDPKVSLYTLNKVADVLSSAILSGHPIPDDYGTVNAILLENGDRSQLEPWKKAIALYEPLSSSGRTLLWLTPVYVLPNDKEVQAVAASLFAKLPSLELATLSTTLLEYSPAYRSRLLHVLSENAVADKHYVFDRIPDQYLDNGVRDWLTRSLSRVQNSAAQYPLRISDIAALGVARWQHAPEFGVSWSNARKDEAIREITLFVSRHENVAGWSYAPKPFSYMGWGW